MSPRRGKLNSAPASTGENGILTIEEYRKLLGDFETPDEQIVKRLEYIASFCRTTIRAALQQIYAQQNKCGKPECD